MSGLVDSHCHVVAAEFDADREAVFERARMAGVELIVCPATDLASARAAVRLKRAGRPVAPAVGVHPGSIDRLGRDDWDQIRELANETDVVAIGETGLDYYRAPERGAEQRDWFVRHLALASERDLPVIVHNREADADVLRAIADWRGDGHDRIAVLHCFVGSPDLAERALALGCYLGFGGPLTFRSADHIREVARLVPSDRILVETDAPYLAPVPRRGQRNEPAYVRGVVERLADVRDTPVEEMISVTAENARRVFAKALDHHGTRPVLVQPGAPK